MKSRKVLPIIASLLSAVGVSIAAPVPDKPITVRVASYNVEFSRSATPEQIGEMFKPYKLDIIGFDEAPDGEWTARVGKVLGMQYSFVGTISSANHKNKYKTILSRTPLEGTEEHKLTGCGWNPASAVRATTKIEGITFAFYSLHICNSDADNDISWLPAWMQKRAEERDSGKAQKDLDEYYQTRMKGEGEKPYLGLHPLSNPMYPSAGYNAVINPLKHLAMKGILLQLGNDYPFIAYRELEKKGMLTKKSGYDSGWQDNYMILKRGYRITPATLPYVPGDWRRSFGDKELPIGLVLPPGSDLDVYAAHNREIREMHRRTAEKAKGIGLILPGMENIPSSGQPADDVLLAERCRQWVLGDVYGKERTPATGPALDRVEARFRRATIHFKEGTADGLKATGKALDFFETAGPDRVFAPARARIDGSTVKLESDGPVQFVRYNWTYRPDHGLVNSAGLPALPFSTDPGWEFAWEPPPEEATLPEEYTTTANKWDKSDVAIISGQISNMSQGDSEPIPVEPGPIGFAGAPVGPNIYVMRTLPGSPAHGKILPGDIIYGVNGQVFSDGPGVAHDAQYFVLADAITESETDEAGGKMVLSLRRGTKLMDVELQLKVMGSYSSTTPYYCEKSENIVRDAEEWISLTREEGGEWQMKVVETIDHAPEGWTDPKFDDSSWDTARVPISWTMYHTALFRGKFNIEDKAAVEGLRVMGKFFQQQNVVIYLNGKLVAKVDQLDRGLGMTEARLTDYALKLLKKGENTIAISSRHKRRWGGYRGTYITAATVRFWVEAKKAE